MKFNWHENPHTRRWTCSIPPKFHEPIIKPGEFGVKVVNTNQIMALMEIYKLGGRFQAFVKIMTTIFASEEYDSMAEAQSWCEENVINLAQAVVNGGQELCSLLTGEGDEV